MQKPTPNHKSGNNDSQYKPKQRSRKIKHAKKLPKRRNWKVNQNKWLAKQNTKYIQFLLNQNKNDQNQMTPQDKRYYYRLGVFVKSRTTKQCRTHHKKMLKSYKTILGIIQHLKLKHGIQLNSNSSQQSMGVDIDWPSLQRKQQNTMPTRSKSNQKLQSQGILEEPHQKFQEWEVIDQKVWLRK